MKLNREVLVSAIIQHKDSFFKLLDYINAHDGALEFPEMEYLKLYDKEICKDPDDINTQVQMNIDSLLENGIFIHRDNHTGMISIEKVIIDLLRFLDTKRNKELSHFEFEQLRKQTVDITESIMGLKYDSLDYKDAKAAFNGHMSLIHSKIKENVIILTNQVDAIAIDYKRLDSGESEISVFSMYEKVSALYDRYVMPCYNFIDPSMEMSGTKSFSKAVQELTEYHADVLHKFTDANSIQFKKTAITSYYKNIDALVRKLKQFSVHLAQDRQYFMAIENAFVELKECLIPLRHGKQRNRYLTRNASIFKNLSCLDGLGERKYSTKFNRNNATALLRFKEYLTVINENQIKEKPKPLIPLPPEKYVSLDRQIIISKLLFTTPIPTKMHDVYRFIYDLLQAKLDHFELVDVLYGLEVLLPMLNHERLISLYERQQFVDEQYFLNYLVLKYKEESPHV